MKKLYSFMLAAIVVVNVAAPAAVVAEDDGTTQQATTTQTTTDDSTKPEDTAEESKNRTKRIDEYKKLAAQKLTQAQQKRVASVCKTSQGKVSSVHGSLKSAVEKRKNYYATISTKLEDLIAKLEAASIDVTDLKAALTEIDAKAVVIAQAATDYETALSDLAAMDCVADPVGFKSALAVAREKRTALQAEVHALREYVKTTVKSLLQAAREQVASNATDDNV